MLAAAYRVLTRWPTHHSSLPSLRSGQASLITAQATRSALEADDLVLLDAAAPDPDTGGQMARLFQRPRRTIEAGQLDEVPAALEEIDGALAEGMWVAGWMTYECGYALERTLRDVAPATSGRLLWFGVYDAPIELAPAAVTDALGPADGGPADARFSLDLDVYKEAVDALRAHIGDGDIYQANLTAPLEFTFAGDPRALYAGLRERQPAPYAALVNAGGRRILSLSPELFFRIEGGTILTRPMKGTAEADGPALAADEKNRAENLMIVDLLRNDLSRVTVPGSVRVPSLFAIERYPTLWQMTSTVAGTLRDGWRLSEVLHALFPCGSVTGAPKIRAMQILAGLERSPRGVYCGAIGYASPHGEAAFSVPIRTVELEERDGGWLGRMGLGSGIVWDSVAAEEYAECLLKGRFLTGAGAAAG